MHQGNSSAGELSKSQSPAHAEAASHRQHPSAYKTSGAAKHWLGTASVWMENALRTPTRKAFCQYWSSAEGAKAGGKGATLSNHASIPVCHSAATPLRGDGNIISRAHYLSKVKPRGVLSLNSCVLTTGERLLYRYQTPSHCFPQQNFNVSAC